MAFASPLSWPWVLAPPILAALGAAAIVMGLGHLLFGRVPRGAAHIAAGLPLVLIGLVIGLLAFNTQVFARLANERAVADVSVAALDANAGLYRVTVRRLDGTAIVTGCTIQGDEWLLSARVQKWKPWATLLGLDATYTLDQIANKYASAARGDGKAITACDLAGPEPAVNHFLPPGFVAWLWARSYAEQRHFGSAVYMTDGALYRVTMTQSGLNAEAVNPIAQAAVIRGL